MKKLKHILFNLLILAYSEASKKYNKFTHTKCVTMIIILIQLHILHLYRYDDILKQQNQQANNIIG